MDGKFLRHRLLLTAFKRGVAACLLGMYLLTGIISPHAFALFSSPFSIEKAEAATGINKIINYQGKVSAIGGAAVANGTYNMRFKIYDAATGGNVLWSENWTNSSTRVTMTGGLFSVGLGTHVTMTGSVNFNTDNIYLQVEFDPGNDGTFEETFAPRRRFGSVPYAFNTDTVDGLDSGSFIRSDADDTATGSIVFSNVGIGIEVVGTASGKIIQATQQLRSSGSLVVEGTTTLASYASCAIITTDANGNLGCGSSVKASTGSVIAVGDSRYVNTSGDTMTGALRIMVTGGSRMTLGLEVENLLSGSVIRAQDTLASSGNLVVEGAMSGASLFVGSTIRGAGLTDCDLTTSTVRWDETTGRFSCGTIAATAAEVGTASFSGAVFRLGNPQYVNIGGDTMTGALAIDVRNGVRGTVGLNVINTISGAVIHAEKSLTSSGVLVVEGTGSFISPRAGQVPLQIIGASGQSANLTEWINSAGSKMFAVNSDGSLQQMTNGTWRIKDFSGNDIFSHTNGGLQTFGGGVVGSTFAFSTILGGTADVLAINPSINFAGNGTYTALAINVTENSVPSGMRYLAHFKVGSVSKFAITSSGSVGIGTSTPVSALTVSGAAIIGRNIGSAFADAGLALEIIGTASGRVLRAQNTLASSGSLVWEGAASGASLYLGGSLQGAGLTDCDLSTSTLRWDATTGRFSCGTIAATAAEVGTASFSGAVFRLGNPQYVNIGGDTMTGTLIIDLSSGFVGLNVKQTLSGSRIYASTSLASSGTLVVENTVARGSGALTVIQQAEFATGAYIYSSGTVLALDSYSSNGTNKHILFGYQGQFDTNLYRSAVSTLKTNGSFFATNVISGSVLRGNTLASSGSLVWEGAASGATLVVSGQFSGAGLTDCDLSTQKLTWDSSTNRFGCTTLNAAPEVGTASFSGAVFRLGNPQYVNVGGDTMTGTLIINLSSGFVGLNVKQTLSGSKIYASTSLASSGTLVVENTVVRGSGALTVIQSAEFGTGAYMNGSGGALLALDALGIGKQTPHIVFGYAGNFDTNLYRSAASTLRTDGSLFVMNTVSGAVIRADRTLASSGTLVVEGAMSGASLYVASSLNGAGLTDCDAASSKLLWDATTGRFSCGTIATSAPEVGTASFSGAVFRLSDSRYVNTSGDTMTGALTINITNGLRNTVGLNVINTISGAVIQASKTLASSGGLVWEGTASGNTLAVSRVASSLIPSADNTWSLGTSALRWKDLYLTGGSLHIGSSTMEGKITYQTAGLEGLALYGNSSDTNASMFISSGGIVSIGSKPLSGPFKLSVSGSGLTDGHIARFTDHAENAYTAITNSSGSFSWYTGVSDTGVFSIHRPSVGDGLFINGDRTVGIPTLANCDTIDTDANGNLVCGTDAGASGGVSFTTGDARYVNTSGDTMTGALTINITSGVRGTVGLNVINTISGAVIRAQKTLASSGTLVWEGAASGASLYLGGSLQGAGLTDCDLSTSALRWDATTGRFSCGTITATAPEVGTASFSGAVFRLGNPQYVNIGGDTMTGALAINITSGTINTLGLRVLNTFSGAIIQATQQLRSSGSLIVEGATRLQSGAIISRAANSDFLTLNDTTNGDSVSFKTGTGDPNGSVNAQLGSLFIASDTGKLWKNNNGVTQWSEIATGSGSAHMAKITRDAAQSIPNAAVSKVYFDTEEFDVGDIANITPGASGSGRITIKKAGKYLVTGLYQPTSVSTNVITYIFKNGVAVSQLTDYGPSAALASNVTDVLDLGVNDYIELYVYQDLGSAQNMNTALSVKTRLSVIQIDANGGGAGGSSKWTDNGSVTYLTDTADNLAIGALSADTKLEVIGTISGSALQIKNSIASSGSLVWEGAASGASLYLGGSLQGAGLTDCDLSTSVLKWDATTGRFSCGTAATAAEVGTASFSGAVFRLGNPQYVNVGGDTMTGALAINITSGTINTLGLRVLNTFSGAIIQATQQLRSSGSLIVEGATRLQSGAIISRAANSDFLTLNDTTNGDSVSFKTGTGDPNGSVNAQLGSLFIASDTGKIWKNNNGTTQWVEVTTGSGTAHMAKMTRDAAQSIPTAQNRKVYFDTKEFDVGDIANVTPGTSGSGRITIRKSGKYLITASAEMSPINTGERSEILIRKNNSTIIAAQRIYSNGTIGDSYPNVTTVIDLAAGDYIEMLIYHDHGTAVDTLTAFHNRPMISVVQVDAVAGAGGSSLWTDGGAFTYLTDTVDNLAIGATSADTKLEVIGTISGSALQIKNSIASSGSLVWEGVASGATLVVSGQFSGAGLTDCDLSSQKLTWDSSTNRFGCATLNAAPEVGTASFSGAVFRLGNPQYVNVGGDTMTGTLIINLSSGFVGLNVKQTLSGSKIYASTSLASSGTLIVENTVARGSGALTVIQSAEFGTGAYIYSSGTVLALDTYSPRGDNKHILFGYMGVFDTNLYRSAVSTLKTNGSFFATNVISGSVLRGNTLASSGSLTWEGAASGATLVVSGQFSGAGLTDCDAASSRLLWDATTGRFSCGTISASSSFSTGNVLTIGDDRYVRTAGDTMTGALVINITNGVRGTVGLNVINTISGAVIRAQKTLASSGQLLVEQNGTSVGSGALSVVNTTRYGTGAYMAASGAVLVLDSAASAAGKTPHIMFGYRGTFDVTLARTAAYTLTLTGHLLPGATNTFDLGSDTMRWRDLYVSGGTMHIGSSGDEATIGYNTSSNTFAISTTNRENAFTILDSNGFIGIGTSNPDTLLEVIGTVSGSILHAQNGLRSSGSLVVEGNAFISGTLTAPGLASSTSLASSGSLTWEGAASGASLYLGGSLQGAGLTDCDLSSSQLKWDATTGRFSCGTISSAPEVGTASFSGAVFRLSNPQYVNIGGDTMTGGLVINMNSAYAVGSGALSVVNNQEFSTGAYIYSSGSVLALDSYSTNGENKHILFGARGSFDTNLYRAGANVLKTDDSFYAAGSISGANLEILGLMSGSIIHAEKSITSSGTIISTGDITTRGTLSGAALSILGNASIGSSNAGIIAGAARYLTITTRGTNTVAALELNGRASTSGNAVSRMSFINNHSANYEIARIESYLLNATDEGGLRFYTAQGGNSVRMTITPGGNVGIGTTDPSAALEVLGTISGTTLYARQSLTTSGTLVWEGAASGATLYLGGSLQGAGLTDCDNGTTSKLLWDATTGRFSCGTDTAGGSGAPEVGTASFSGALFRLAGPQYVNVGGDTMTGALTINITGGTRNTLGLNVINTISGAVIRASKTLASSGAIVTESGAFIGADILFDNTRSHTIAIPTTSDALGKSLLVSAGNGQTIGGALILRGGTNTFYGEISIAGSGDGGGDININAGDAGVSTEQGGNLVMTAGDGGNNPGYVTISGGSNTGFAGAGGAVYIYGGRGIGGSASGSIILGITAAGIQAGNVGIGTINPKAKLDVLGSMSGSALLTLSNYRTCTLKTTATGMVICGSDETGGSGAPEVGTASFSGALFRLAGSQYVNVGGDTMTGALVINMTGGDRNTVGLNVINTISGAVLHAEKSLTSSGTLSVAGAARIVGGVSTTSIVNNGTHSSNNLALTSDADGQVTVGPYTGSWGPASAMSLFKVNNGAFNSIPATGEFSIMEAGGTIGHFGGRTFTGTSKFNGLLINTTFGGATDNIFNGTAISALRITPTINIATTSTSGYNGIYADVTETSISATATNYLMNLGANGATKFLVTNKGNVAIGLVNTGSALAVSGSVIINSSGIMSTSARPDSGIGLEIIGTASGRVLRAQNTLASSGTLVWEGAASGASLYIASSIQGAGLVDCDVAGSSKLLWDATTGRFSCGTDQTGGGSAGLVDHYVLASGDTMTGALVIQNGTTHTNTTTPLLNVRGTMSGVGLTLAGSGSPYLLTTSLRNNTLLMGTGSMSYNTTGSTTAQLYITGRMSNTGAYAVQGLNGPLAPYVQGNYAYIPSSGNNSLVIYDVSNPKQPSYVSAVTTGLNQPSQVVVQGKYAYVINFGNNTLSIFDVSNVAAPVLAGSTTSSMSVPYWLGVQGRYAYVLSSSNNTLSTFDVSNPNLPTLTSTTTSSISGPEGGYIHGRYLFVASSGNSTLIAFDLTNPAAPVRAGTITTNLNLPTSVVVQGKYAYVINLNTGLTVFDVSNPSSMTALGTTTTGISTPYEFTVQGRYAYVLNSTSKTISVYDIGNPRVPTFISSRPTLGPAGIAVQGRYAYVTMSAAGVAGLAVIDLGGAFIQNLEAGTLTAGSILGNGGLQIMGNASFAGSLTVARGINVSGPSVFSSNTSGSYALRIVNQTSRSGALLITSHGASRAPHIMFASGRLIDTNLYRSAARRLQTDGSLYATNILSGSIVYGGRSLASSGTLVWEGAGSGASLNMAGGNITWSRSGAIVYNEFGNNVDIRMESDTNDALFFLDSSTNRIGIGARNPDTTMEIIGALSGTTIQAGRALASSGSLTWEGAASGSTLYVARSLQGAGLTDCDLSTSQLKWDATTGRFSCGTISGGTPEVGTLSFSGAVFRLSDMRYVNVEGDTMTGALVINMNASYSVGSGALSVVNNKEFSTGAYIFSSGTVLALDSYSPRGDNKHILFGYRGQFDTNLYRSGLSTLKTDGSFFATNVISGSVLRGNTLASSGTLVWEGAASGSSLYLGSSFRGAGLVSDCSALAWTSATGRFSCGSGGGGAFVPLKGGSMTGSLQTPTLNLSGVTLASLNGFTEALNIHNAGYATNGVTRITPTGNLTNIGSIQSGEIHATMGGTFAAKVTNIVGSGPRYVSTGDVNGDGKIDLVVPNSNSDTISVLMNAGTGSFKAKADFSTAASAFPYATSLGDLNGDGRLDIVVANNNYSYVSVFMNTGSGKYATRSDYTIGGNSIYSVAVADVNGDGKLDLAATSFASNIVSVLLNNGNGTFGAKTDYSTGTGPIAVGFGDFNGDGTQDMAVSSYSVATVSIFMNTGNGTFGPRINHTTGSAPYGLAIGDLNGDGKNDIAVPNSSSTTLSVLINNGTGSMRTKVDYATENAPISIAMGDLNGDGKLDLAVANSNSTTISTFINKGNGTFNTKVSYASDVTPLNIAIADFNGDGKNDLAVANSASQTVSTYMNTTATIMYASAGTGGYVSIGTNLMKGKLTIQQNTEFSTGAYINGSGAALMVLDANGKADTTKHILFGYSGNFDTNLYRSAASTLKTDGSLHVLSTISGASLIATTGAIGQGDIDATFTIRGLRNSRTLRLENGGAADTNNRFIDAIRDGSDSEFIVYNNGDVRYDGTASGPADYAEWMETNDVSLGTGELVSLDPTRPHAIKRATGINDPNLFGVISTKPGILGTRATDVTVAAEERENDPSWKKVAFLGQVPTKVKGPVAVNDPITSSDTPGVGMKASLGQATVCIALEAHTGNDIGTINCLLGRNNLSSIGLAMSSGSALHARDLLSSSGSLSIEGMGYFGSGIVIRSSTTNASANLLTISSNVGSANNTVLRVDASGSVYTDGTFNSEGADYAEWFYSTDNLEKGEVVCIDVTRSNAVTRCTSDADSNVMGIVSTNPAFIGNSINGATGVMPPGYALIGLIGQVPAKVKIENDEAIRPGDSLTAGSIPGYARRARAGESTVGVALEGLENGEGVINVLISRRNQSLTVEAVEENVLKTIAAMEIEDEVQIMVASTLEDLNVDSQITTEVERQLAGMQNQNLAIEAIRSELNTLKAELAALKSQTGATTTVVTQTGSYNQTASIEVEGTLTTGGDARIGGDLHIDGSLNASSLFVPNGMSIDGGVVMRGLLDAMELRVASGAVVDGVMTINGALVLGSGAYIEGGSGTLSIGDLIVQNSLFVMGDVTIEGLATFLGDVEVKGELIVSNKQAGFAMIPATGTSVTVYFGSGMKATPVVTASPDVPVLYAVSKTSATGFTIRLAGPAMEDITFSWHALSTASPMTITANVLDDGSILFPTDDRGVPVSSNMVWNACIRNITLLDSEGQPLNCGRYHDQFTWSHPDLGMSFIWNTSVTPPLLKLPGGYEPTVTESAENIAAAFNAGQDEEVTEEVTDETSSSSAASSVSSESSAVSAISSEASESSESSASSAASESSVSSEAPVEIIPVDETGEEFGPQLPEEEPETTPEVETEPAPESGTGTSGEEPAI